MAQIISEILRKEKLLQAQEQARHLLSLIEENKYVHVGASEQEVNEQIFELAKKEFGVTKHWHKRIVRAGINSVLTSKANPENRIIEMNDLVYVDLGPVFEEFEGDIGKTYLMGSDAKKQKLINDLERIFVLGKSHYLSDPDQTGAALYDFVVRQCEEADWNFGNEIAGHIVSEFAHIQIYGNVPENRIWKQNTVPMSAPGSDGKTRYWILEIHLVDKEGQYGGFFEDILL